MIQNTANKIKEKVFSIDLLSDSVIMTSSLSWGEALSVHVVGINGAWIYANVMVNGPLIGPSVH